MNSYAEWSPSGEGVHVLVRASLPTFCRHRGNGIEIYDTGRYFTVTGRILSGASLEIEPRQAAIDHLLADVAPTSCESHERHIYILDGPKNDDELLLRARCARNGEKFTKLWLGDLSEYGGDHGCSLVHVAGLLRCWRAAHLFLGPYKSTKITVLGPRAPVEEEGDAYLSDIADKRKKTESGRTLYATLLEPIPGLRQ